MIYIVKRTFYNICYSLDARNITIFRLEVNINEYFLVIIYLD